jgi:tRNA threonylcarbamoyladenosine biosynthesis protein TsaE
MYAPQDRVLADEAATLDLGASLALAAREGLVVFLHGELGSGKTTLARGFLRALGHEGLVKSPTYTLVEPYEVGGRQVFHFDCYRLNSAEDLELLGAREYFGPQAVCLIEWPERAQGALPQPDLEIVLGYANGGRHARIMAHSPRGGEVIERLDPALR